MPHDAANVLNVLLKECQIWHLEDLYGGKYDNQFFS